MLAYLTMMAPRLLALRDVLKSTGSIYLHCDSTASHYLRVLMDTIFGPGNFRNEIIWKRFNFHADAKRFGKVADVVDPIIWTLFEAFLVHNESSLLLMPLRLELGRGQIPQSRMDPLA